MVFEIFKMHSCQILLALYNFITFSQCPKKDMNKIKEELLMQIMEISIQLEDVGISLKTLN